MLGVKGVKKMVYFLKPKRKVPYEVRIGEIVKEVNSKGEISLNELVAKWCLDPSYIKRLIRIAITKYNYLVYDDDSEILYIKERKEEKKG
jgi:hypothetical protein